MFEEYIYCNRKALINYISQIKNINTRKKVNIELSLPYLKISSNFEFDKDIQNLTNEELCILFECLFKKYSDEYYFDLVDTELKYSEEHLVKNTFIKKNALFVVPEIAEQVDAIRGLSSLKGLLGDEIKKIIAQDNLSQSVLEFVLENKNTMIPIYAEENNVIFYFRFDNSYGDVIEKLDENITIVGKIRNVKSGKVKVYDMFKDLLELNRSMRRQIKDIDEAKSSIYLEATKIYEIEVLFILV